MAGTDQGTALIFAAVEAAALVRAYMPGLGYEGGTGHGVGQPTHDNDAWNLETTTIGTLAGAHTATSRTLSTKAAATLQAAITSDPDAVTGIDELWWEDLHILPRAKIEFGNLITQVESEYEIYNSYRDGTLIGLDSINATAVQPGVTLPEMTATYSIEAQTSALNTSTTGQTTAGAVGSLGTLVKLKVVAATDGLSSFDGTITFADVGTETVTLDVSGARIVLIPMEYEAPVNETLAFLTDIMTAVDGKEQRLALRKNPRQLFEVLYKLDGNDRQRMQNFLMDWTDNLFGFPLQHERVFLSAATNIGATSFSTSGAADVDFRVGGLAVLFTDANTFDVITIATVSDTTITSTDPVLNAYAANTVIWPVRTAIIRGAVAGSRHQNDLQEFRVTFEVIDNNTGTLTGDVSAYSTYNSRTLFDGCNVVSGPTPEEYGRRVHRIDNSTGKVHVSSTWDRNKRRAQKGFVLHNRAEILAFRKTMIGLAGRQKSFYLPTFIDDLTPTDDLTISTKTMEIANQDYARFVVNRQSKIIAKVTYTDGTAAQVNEIDPATAVTAPTSSTELLTFVDNWAVTKTAALVKRVEFYELMRFDSDNVNITYPRIGLAECSMPVFQVFDDNV